MYTNNNDSSNTTTDNTNSIATIKCASSSGRDLDEVGPAPTPRTPPASGDPVAYPPSLRHGPAGNNKSNDNDTSNNKQSSNASQ